MKVIPTLLTTTPQEFITQLDTFQKHYSRIQLDITDGKLVPNVTVQIDEIITLAKDQLVAFFPLVRFDFHLMVSDFEKELKKIQNLQELGVKIDTVLINADLHPNISAISKQYQFSIGLDLFPKVEVEEIANQYNLQEIPVIQVMTVNPGFQGSAFLPDMLTKIQQLRAKDYRGIIMIDGGVNEKTIPIISDKKYKPDYLCIGSFLTKAGNKLKKRIAELKLINK